jgi:phage regulator Rha-like protein
MGVIMKRKSKNQNSLVKIETLILVLRGERVILDYDLAALYGVRTRVLNQAIKRNIEKFPEDFMFRLTKKDLESLILQNETSNNLSDMRSQIVTASKRNIRFLPFAFTEHGAIMAANVLNSPRAVQMSVFVVRAFIKMREALTANKALTEKLVELEKKLTSRLDVHEKAIVHILKEIKKLMPLPLPEPKRRPIGFRLQEDENGK